jgi:hypothetical protein
MGLIMRGFHRPGSTRAKRCGSNARAQLKRQAVCWTADADLILGKVALTF